MNSILSQFFPQQPTAPSWLNPAPTSPSPYYSSFQPTPAPAPPAPNPAPQIAPISPLMPGQPTSMQPLPAGAGPGTVGPGGPSGFGATMLNGMLGPAGSASAPLGQNAGIGSILAKSLLAMFL